MASRTSLILGGSLTAAALASSTLWWSDAASQGDHLPGQQLNDPLKPTQVHPEDGATEVIDGTEDVDGLIRRLSRGDHAVLVPETELSAGVASDIETLAAQAGLDLVTLGPWDPSDSWETKISIEKIQQNAVVSAERLAEFRAQMDTNDPEDIREEADLAMRTAEFSAVRHVFEAGTYITTPSGQSDDLVRLLGDNGYWTVTKHVATVGGQRVDTVFPIDVSQYPELQSALDYSRFADAFAVGEAIREFNRMDFEARRSVAETVDRLRLEGIDLRGLAAMSEADREVMSRWQAAEIGISSLFDRRFYLFAR